MMKHFSTLRLDPVDLLALGRLYNYPLVNEAMHSHASSRLLRSPSLFNKTERQQRRFEGSNVARPGMLREVCELLDSLTREFPLLLSLEDLLWADFSTIACISPPQKAPGSSGRFLIFEAEETTV